MNTYTGIIFRCVAIISFFILIVSCASVAKKDPSKPIDKKAKTEKTTLQKQDSNNLACQTSQLYWPTSEWKTCTPEEQKMDSTKLEQINTYVEKNCPMLRNILISRNGYIVFEKYYRGNANYAQPIFSATKSITSALIGIALEQGHIKSIDQKMYTFFPEYSSEITDQRKKKITIRHLRTMTSGFGPGSGWQKSVTMAFTQPIKSEPGQKFAYSGTASHLLSGITLVQKRF